MEQSPQFVHLRVRSEYSLLEGAVRLAKLPFMCIDMGMPAVAVTDNNNLFGALEFTTIATKHGIQPINGCQFSIRKEIDAGNTTEGQLILLVQNQTGYQNLLKLNTCLYHNRAYNALELSIGDLERYSEGLICLTGGVTSLIDKLIVERKESEAKQTLLELAKIFKDRIYVELHRHKSDESSYSQQEIIAEPVMLQLAYEHGFPIVATNDVYFPTKDMFVKHDALMCIADGTLVEQVAERRRLTPEHYFKSQQEMSELFEDLPEALSNTVEIAKRCSFWAEKRPHILPKFTKNEADELQHQAKEGLAIRMKAISLAAPEQDYQERLDYELGVIKDMGFAGYFLIVADFIKWAKKNGIPVGTGRGSGAGSLVAYALTITDLDPLRFDLIFERFLNPERVSMPDFDVDFCQSRRDEVIQYVKEKYGSEKVAKIVTFDALLSKVAVRDIGRVLGLPYPKIDTIAKLIPRDGANSVSISEALTREPQLQKERDSNPVVKRMFEYTEGLEGLLRNASSHAAGIVIGDRPLDELVPILQDPKSELLTTQFSMKWVEQAGLVKFDFLGLKTLTVIKMAADLLAKRGVEIDVNNLPMNDEKTFEMCAAAKTVAVFQLESAGMKDTLRRLKPTCIEDIVALVALYRPGPMDNIPEYCDVKNGLKKRKKEHDLIDHIVAETHGIIVYQEQVMQIAQSMAGYSLGQADLLRRSIGKKIKKDMEAEQPRFLAGAEKNGVDRAAATTVWDLMAKFAEYGFPKAHAAAYALVTYQTAYLKANYPVEFMTSVMNCDMTDTDKLKTFVGELKRLRINLLPPCINRSEVEFSIKDGEVIYGLHAVRNVGFEPVRIIIEARKDRPFGDLFDFAARVELKSLSKRVLEHLVMSGAFDVLESNRRRVFDSIDLLINYSHSIHQEQNLGQVSLFGEDARDIPPLTLPESKYWSRLTKSKNEFTAIGFFLLDHPLVSIFPKLESKGVVLYTKLIEEISTKEQEFFLAGHVSAINNRTSKNGNNYAFVELTDPSAYFEIAIFNEQLQRVRNQLVVGCCIKALVTAQLENDQVRIRTNLLELIPLDDEAEPDITLKGLRIHFQDPNAPLLVYEFLQSNCRYRSGRGEISFCPLISELDYEFEIKIPQQYVLNPQIRNAINSIEGVLEVQEY